MSELLLWLRIACHTAACLHVLPWSTALFAALLVHGFMACHSAPVPHAIGNKAVLPVAPLTVGRGAAGIVAAAIE